MFRPFIAILLLLPLAHESNAQPIRPQAEFQVGDRLRNAPAAGELPYREIIWDELLPKGWSPMAFFKGIDFSQLKDNDPRAIAALEKIKDAWNDAPVNTALSGQRIRLPGFVIPLERKGDLTSEYLLVPYFGACIHVPPPPSNQMIHVIARKPVRGLNTMDPVWVSGTLTIHRAETGMGMAGYRITSDSTQPYRQTSPNQSPSVTRPQDSDQNFRHKQP
jgi:uncharacterized protein